MCPPVTLDDLFPAPVAPPPSPAPADPAPEPAPPDATSTTATPSTTTLPPDTTIIAPPAPPAGCEPFRYDMLWPLAGRGQIISGFGADRDHGARYHKGVDISAPKLTPVVAVADGVVMSVTQEVGTADCCWLSLRHHDGWQSYYVHLNNDLHGADDGMGSGVRPDLEAGTEVKAGEVIGWVGDSGNAEETIDHLHFELRNRAGVAVDAVPSVRAAQRRAQLPDSEPSWPYADDDGLDSEWLAATLVSRGLFLPCDETMIAFCPGKLASPDFVGEIVRHFTGKTSPPLEGRLQSLPTSLSPGAHTVRMLELALGCEPMAECLDYGIPSTELARLAAWVRIDILVTSLLPENPEIEGGMPTVSLPSAADAEARLRSEGAIGACNPTLDDQLLLTREQALISLVSWMDGVNPEPCSPAPQLTR